MEALTRPPAFAYAAATTEQRRDAATPRVVLVPVGAVEQHGPHLPLGVDSWIAAELCARVTGALAPGMPDDAITVAEPIGYGCSWHHTTFRGTVSLRTATFISMLTDVCASLAADGNLVVIVNGHGGNRGPMQVATADLAAAGVQTWSVSYFELLADVVARRFDDPHAAGHACAMETSIMLALWPELVRSESIPAGSTPPAWPDQHLFHADAVRTVRTFDTVNPTGVIGRPELSSAAAGVELVEAATERLADIVTHIVRMHDGGAERVDA